MSTSDADMLLIRADILNEITEDILSKSLSLESDTLDTVSRSKILQDSIHISRQALAIAAERVIGENEGAKTIVSSYASLVLRILDEELTISKHKEISLLAKRDCINLIAADIKNDADTCMQKWENVQRVVSETSDFSKPRQSVGQRPESLATRRIAEQYVDANKSSDTE